MRRPKLVVRLGTSVAFAAVALWAVAHNVAAEGDAKSEKDAKPSITITEAPNIPPGEGPTAPIRGRAGGVNFAEHKVVLYAYGDKWYVQPWIASPYTAIDKEGNWRNATHGGYEYAALLVKPSYKPPSTAKELPEVGDEILAIAKAKPTPKEEKKEEK